MTTFVSFVLILTALALIYGTFDYLREMRADAEYRRRVRIAKRIWDGED